MEKSHDKTRRRASASHVSPGKTRTRQSSNTDAKERRRGSTGVQVDEDGFAGSSAAAAGFPFGSREEEEEEEGAAVTAKVERSSSSVKIRRAPTRSASVGALPISRDDLKKSAEEAKNAGFDDDDMMFDEVDWDNVQNAEPKKKSTSKSRRHSITTDSRPKDWFGDDSVGDHVSGDESLDGDDKKKGSRKKSSHRSSRRQSSDSELVTMGAGGGGSGGNDDDGFGTFKTFGFGDDQASNGSGDRASDRSKGMARAKSATSDPIDSWSGHGDGNIPLPNSAAAAATATRRLMVRKGSEKRVRRHKPKGADGGSTGTETTEESVDVSVNA